MIFAEKREFDDPHPQTLFQKGRGGARVSWGL